MNFEVVEMGLTGDLWQAEQVGVLPFCWWFVPLEQGARSACVPMPLAPHSAAWCITGSALVVHYWISRVTES